MTREPREMRLVIAGYGTVGQALHRLIHDSAGALAARDDVRLTPVAIVRSKGAWVSPDGLAPDDLTDDAWEPGVSALEALGAVEADCLVELTPTNLDTAEPALTHMRAALEAGMHAVTANKGPVVRAYRELRDLAEARGLAFRFEATAGASLPIMSLSDHCLRGNPITRVEGILNGTCNYILTRMAEEGIGYEQALAEAQALGYAEADPTADVGGHDAAAKAVIIGNHALDADVALEDVDVTGIQHVTAEAVQLARKQGYAVRLIAAVDATGRATVAPRLVPEASPLNVAGTLNVVRFHTEHAGPLAITGRGAGGRETASAVLADLVTAAGMG